MSSLVSVSLYTTPSATLGQLLVVAGFSTLPLATGMAILRYRLYDIDLVINRTLVYGTLTAVLVATYLVSVLAFRVVLDPLTGESDLAVAARHWPSPRCSGRCATASRPSSTAASTDVATTPPTRCRRSRGRLRQEVDLETVSDDLRSVVRDTVQPAHVSLWLRERCSRAAVTIPERPRSRKVSP